jgi:hypothetical protein
MTLHLASPISSSFAPVLLEHYHKGMVYLLQASALCVRFLRLGKRPLVMFRCVPPPGESAKSLDCWRIEPLDRGRARRQIWSKLLIRLAELIHYKVGSGLSETLKRATVQKAATECRT